MTVFKDKDGNEITASDFCKGRKDVPKRWARQAEGEPKKASKKEVIADERDADSK